MVGAIRHPLIRLVEPQCELCVPVATQRTRQWHKPVADETARKVQCLLRLRHEKRAFEEPAVAASSNHRYTA